MSCRVLVVPEDPTYNGAILKPLVSRILEDCGRGNAKVEVLVNPKVQGFDHACKQIPAIMERYRHFDLVPFLVDNDGRARTSGLTKIEKTAGRLICCAAIEEVPIFAIEYAGRCPTSESSTSNRQGLVPVGSLMFLTSLRLGVRIFFQAIDDAGNTVLDQRHVEVDEQAKPLVS